MPLKDDSGTVGARLIKSTPVMKIIFKELWTLEYDDVDNSLEDIITKFRNYGKTCHSFQVHSKQTLNVAFNHIEIRNLKPHRYRMWSFSEIIQYDLKNHYVLLNGLIVKFSEIPELMRVLVLDMGVNLESANFFPINLDTYSAPPQNLNSTLAPITAVRDAIETLIRTNSKTKKEVPLNLVVNKLSDLPELSHVKNMTLASSFLEYSADNLDYSLKDNFSVFFDYVKSQFKNMRCDELSMILCDCVFAYDPELVSGESMMIPSFIPFELLQITLKSLSPVVLNLKIRSEACSRFDEAYRMEWDDQEVFKNAVLYNTEAFNLIENVSLEQSDSEDKTISNIVLVADTTDAKTWHLADYENFRQTVKDFMTLFPMKQILLGIHVESFENAREPAEITIRKHLNTILKAIWADTNLYENRDIYVLLNVAGDFVLDKEKMKKIVIADDSTPCKLNYQPAIDFFNLHSYRIEARFSEFDDYLFYASLFQSKQAASIHFKVRQVELNND